MGGKEFFFRGLKRLEDVLKGFLRIMDKEVYVVFGGLVK